MKMSKLINVKFLNIVLLGFGFMFVFTAFQTMANIEKTILASITKDDPSFTGNAYDSLALIYIVYSILSWLTPSVIVFTGAKGAMIIGAATYCIFVLSFLTPNTWLFYTSSVLTGFGATLTWTGQGAYLSCCSNEKTISRNVGLFWAMWQMSLIIGNTFVYYQFHGAVDYIDKITRTIVLIVLGAAGFFGLILLSCLRSIAKLTDDGNVASKSVATDDIKNESIFFKTKEAFVLAMQLFLTGKMLLLSVCFFYAGMQYTFYTGVYATSVGFTLKISESPKEIVGLAGIFIGFGELFSAGLFGWLGNRFPKMRHSYVIIIGMLAQVIAFILIALNLPNNAPFADTIEISYFNPPKVWLALFAGFLLGIGDATVHMKIFSILGTIYAKQSIGAFALYNFITASGAGLSFYCSSYFGLQLQLGILLIIGIISTGCFCYVDMKTKNQIDELEENKSSI